MLTDILNAFKLPKPSALRTDDAQLAMAALLVRIARSDQDYDQVEKDMIIQLLQTRFKLEETSATSLRAQAEALEAKAPDTVRFTKLIKETVPYEDRQSVVADLWAIVLSDDARDAEENAMMRMTANLLGVNDRDSALARQTIENAK
tara:strand:- start:195 stop:635 length:441 start_codon:yes stop_codon:yes gene_type:complete